MENTTQLFDPQKEGSSGTHGQSQDSQAETDESIIRKKDSCGDSHHETDLSLSVEKPCSQSSDVNKEFLPSMTSTKTEGSVARSIISFIATNSSIAMTSTMPASGSMNTSVSMPYPSSNISSCSFSPSKSVVPLEMMPTIPLVPVQVPYDRGSIINVSPKGRGRPSRYFSQLNSSRGASPLSLTIRKGVRVKRLGSKFVRGGRRLVHSVSLDDKGDLGLRNDYAEQDDNLHYSQDDMFVIPSIQEKWPGKNCAFCCLPESSQLGQGEIIRFDATPGFNLPEKDHFTEDVLREASGAKKFKSCLGSFKDKMKSPKRVSGDSNDVVDELSLVGHTERPNLAVLFTTIGQCFAHYMCALWSYGVEMATDETIAFVDKAVVTASEKKCYFCKRLGASLPCKVDECESCFHFPCAMASGALMDMKSLAMVCSSHVANSKSHLSDTSCLVCEKNFMSNVPMLFCCSCGNHYHSSCIKTNVEFSPIVRAGWQCPDCKTCQVCRQPGDEIVCIVCDKAYHIGCARPQGLTHSRNEWKCKGCRVCGDCDSRTPGNGLSSRWHSNFTVCDSCYQLRNKGLACPLCKKAYRVVMQKSMAQCSICKKHVHSHCDKDADLGVIQAKWISDHSYEYTCAVCRNNPNSHLSLSLLPPRSPDREDSQGESIPSEDSNDTEVGLEDSFPNVVKSPFTAGGLLALSNPLSSNINNAMSSSPSTFSSSVSSFTYEKSPGFNSSSYGMRGNSTSFPRRGLLFPRMRGAVGSKLTFGKRAPVVSTARKRGISSIPPARKGRGSSSLHAAKGYRGYFNFQPVTLQVQESYQSSSNSNKEEGEENKIILIDASDKFSIWQDICVMCGAFGQDQEGRLIACSQCGQCYHPYCANVKVNRVVLEKGWRCLDCTVCEGCGERNDEARLVLCEECDISYHIYCMVPPLEQVPAGIWKCKWCAVCQYCGSTNPGKDSFWQQNFSMCGPCYSLSVCPVCDEAYAEDELIIQCSSCSRWLHASDDMIHTEDEAEKCIEKGYQCLMCRSPESLPPHLLPPSPPRVVPKVAMSRSLNNSSSCSITSSASICGNPSSLALGADSPTRSLSPVDFMSKGHSNTQHWMDGTCLSNFGYHQIQNITLPPMRKPRNLRGVRSRSSIDSTGSRELDDDDDEDDERIDPITAPQHWVYGMKEGTLLTAKVHGDPPSLPDGFYTLPGPEQGTFILRKRRYRNIKTVGIGGFQVRARAKKDEDKAREEAEMDPQALEMRRRRSKWRTKKKIKLLEKFPSYIQEAFFGRNLMDTSNIDEESTHMEETDVKETVIVRKIGSSIRLSQDELELISAAKERHVLSKLKTTEFNPADNQRLPDVRTFSLKAGQPDVSAVFSSEKAQTYQAKSPPPPLQSGILPSQSGSSGATSIARPDEKRPKEEKVDDLVEDDENNDAIEALFGVGGSALISDDLVRDIINEEMKDEDTSFNETEERDQIDGEASVDGNKLTDLLGPGFNLDVDDIMKNLRDDTTYDSSSIPDNTLVGSSQGSQLEGRVPSIPVASLNSGNLVQANVSDASSLALTNVSQTLTNVENSHRPVDSQNISIDTNLSFPNQNQTKDLQRPVMKLGNISQPPEIPNPIITYQRHPSSVRPFATQLNHPRGEFVVQSRVVSDTNQNSVLLPDGIQRQSVVNAPQGVVLSNHGGSSASTISHNQAHFQRMTLHSVRTRMPVSNHPQGVGTSPISQPKFSMSTMTVARPVVSFTSTLHNQPQSYNQMNISQSSPRSHSSVVGPSNEVHKVYSANTNENQSLSLTLEEDEALGPKATKAAVLYANIHNPTLKTDVALIQDRERHIKRLWKNLDAEQRKIYAQRARENKKEYFKNKQEYQRALKTQEKVASTSSGVTLTTSPSSIHQIAGGPRTVPSNITLKRYQPDLNVLQTRGPLPQSSSQLGHASSISIQQQIKSVPTTPTTSSLPQIHPDGNEINVSSQISRSLVNNLQGPQNVEAQSSFPIGVQGDLQSTHGSLGTNYRVVNNPSDTHVRPPAVDLPLNQAVDQRHVTQIQLQHQQSKESFVSQVNLNTQQQTFVRHVRSVRPEAISQGQFREPLPPLGNQGARARVPLSPTLSPQHSLDPNLGVVIVPHQHQMQQRFQQDSQHQIHHSLQQGVITPIHQLGKIDDSGGAMATSSYSQHQSSNVSTVLSTGLQENQSTSTVDPDPSQLMGINRSLQDSVPELPESVTRELEQLEKEREKKNQDMNPSAHFSAMDDDILSRIGDINEFLEFAVSDRDRESSTVTNSKLTDDIFRRLEENETKSDQKIENPNVLGASQSTHDIATHTARDLSNEHTGGMNPQSFNASPTPTGLVASTPSEVTSQDNSMLHSQATPLCHSSPVTMTSHGSSPNVSPLTEVHGSPQLSHLSSPQALHSSQVRPLIHGHIQQQQHQHQLQIHQQLQQIHPQQQQLQSQQLQPQQQQHLQPQQHQHLQPQQQQHLQSQQQQLQSHQQQHHPQQQQQQHQHPSVVQGYGTTIPMNARIVCHQGPGGSPRLMRPHVTSSVPPPPYPGHHPPSYPRSQQILSGDGFMVRSTPVSSPMYGNPGVGPHRMVHVDPYGHPRFTGPLLMQEQPLLIEDIIEEEKREQMKQSKTILSPQQSSVGDTEGGYLVGGNTIRGQFHRPQIQMTPGQSEFAGHTSQTRTLSAPYRSPADSGLHPALLQAGSRTPTGTTHQPQITIKTLSPPPLPPDNPQTESDFQMQHQYENWLSQQNNLIHSQQKVLETEINKLRRQKKSLSSRQRTLKKNGQELNEIDALEFDRVQRESSVIQKQLDTCRKSSRQHSMLINEYNTKKRQRQNQMIQSRSPTGIPQQPIMTGPGHPSSSPMHSTPQSPLIPHSPSSQHSLGMSPMVPSPHTPVASPNSAVIPQHSPHSMIVHVPHRSPGGDHNSGFSPQSRLPSPSPNSSMNYCGSAQAVSPLMGHQSMRVRTPVLSPSGVGSQGNQMSPHMMVVRQSFPSTPVNPQQNQTMVMRHQYAQNILPMRRPSCSGPVLSPSSSTVCHSPSGPIPSPVSNMSLKNSPVQGGLRSPLPLSSPQMQNHYDNPSTPLTPRSNERMPSFSDSGSLCYQVSSPHSSKMIPTPPSPYFSSGNLSGSSNVPEGGSNTGISSNDSLESNALQKKSYFSPEATSSSTAHLVSRSSVGVESFGENNFSGNIPKSVESIKDNIQDYHFTTASKDTFSDSTGAAQTSFTQDCNAQPVHSKNMQQTPPNIDRGVQNIHRGNWNNYASLPDSRNNSIVASSQFTHLDSGNSQTPHVNNINEQSSVHTSIGNNNILPNSESDQDIAVSDGNYQAAHAGDGGNQIPHGSASNQISNITGSECEQFAFRTNESGEPLQNNANTLAQVDSNRGIERASRGGGISAHAPVPAIFLANSFNRRNSLGLKGGSLVKTRWGHLKFGLKGGFPLPGDEPDSVPKTTVVSTILTVTSTTMTISSSISTSQSSAAETSYVTDTKVFAESKENLPVVKSRSITPLDSMANIPLGTYVSHAPTSIPALSTAKIVLPEPSKSDIPPSSRHQAVIGIPGGGSIITSTLYSTPSVDVGPGIRVPISSVNYSVPTSYPKASNTIDSGFVQSSNINPDVKGGNAISSIVPTSNIAILTTVANTNIDSQSLSSLAKDVNTLTAVVNVSSQISNNIAAGLTPSKALVSLASVESPCISQISLSKNDVDSSLNVTTSSVLISDCNTLKPSNTSTSGITNKVFSSGCHSTNMNLQAVSSVIPSTSSVLQTVSSCSSVTTLPLSQSTGNSSYTLHHFPQQKGPVLMSSNNSSSMQMITPSGSISASLTSPFSRTPASSQQHRQIGTNEQSLTSSPVQDTQLPSLSQINSGHLTKTQVVQSLTQYGHVVQSTPNGQLIFQQQQPTSIVLSNNGGHVRMMSQQVMMPQGVLKGGSVVVRSSSPVPGGVRMMMIRNPSQNISTVPPVSKSNAPMMPPPSAKSPALYCASPGPRVSPAPSPVSNIPSPHSPQVRSHSPHRSSPTNMPHHMSTSTPPLAGIQVINNRKEGEDIKFNELEGSVAFAAVRSKADNSEGVSNKDIHLPSAPNALLKQLLQNAGCTANNTGQSTQLVLLRSTPSGFSTQISQVASQIPNPPNAVVSKSTDSLSNSQGNVANTSVLYQPRILQGSRPVNTSHATLPEKPISLSGVQSINQTQLPRSVVINQNSNAVSISNTPRVLQGQAYRLQTAQYVRQDGNTQSKVTSNVEQHGAVVRPNLHIQNQATPNLVNHCRAQALLATTNDNSAVVSQNSGSIVMQNKQQHSPMLVRNASVNETNDLNSPLRTEMHITIPEGTTGDQTPDLNTPNDSCDDLDESKKARKKLNNNQNRRKSQTKDNKAQPVKRVRQNSRLEEDYDTYIENMMTQLRAMTPLAVSEPAVPKNLNVCPIYGSGDLPKLTKKKHGYFTGLLEGCEESLTVKGMNDYYNTQPYGSIPPLVTPAKKGPTQRGFYNQEFTPPKIGLPLDSDYSSEVEMACQNTPSILYHRESDSPDTVLSTSSPECVLPDSPPPLRGLRLVEMDDDSVEDGRSKCISPSVPLLVPIPSHDPLQQLEQKSNIASDDKENLPMKFSHIYLKDKIGLTPSLPLKDNGNVTVSLTLSSQGAQDISSVLRSLANILNVPPPVSYNINDFSIDNDFKFNQKYKHIVNGTNKEELVDMQSVLNGIVQFCKQCNSLTRAQISKNISEIPFLSKNGLQEPNEISFCSSNCYNQFKIIHEPPIHKFGSEADQNHTAKPYRGSDDLPSLGNERRSSNASLLDDSMSDDVMKEILKVPQFDENNRRSEKHKLVEETYPKQADGKRFRGLLYKHWNKDNHVLPSKYEKPTNKEMTDLLFGMQITFRKSRLPEDCRVCSFCPMLGDSVADGSSRLLNYDLNKWVHLNCALWAEDVYETMSGSLMSLELALKKSVSLICLHCEQPGASIKCFKVRCSKVFHLNCAVKEGCMFYKNKTVYCPEHLNKGDKENELSSLSVPRRVFVERDENRQIASVMHHTEMNHLLRIGSLVLMNIGQLLPHQLQAFHSPQCIYPVGYHVIRFYWSMRFLHKRCAYECFINDASGEPEFKIVVREDGYDDLTFISRSPKGVWSKILEPIVAMRQQKGVVKLFSQYISGEDLFGLTEPAIVRILESMPGVDSLSDYTFKFGSNPLFELPLAINPTGCARSEPFNRSHLKRHHGVRTSAGSIKTSCNLRTAATIASITMNFDPFLKSGHTRFFQYKKMNNEWRSSVYLARSKIQGLGLYAARDIEKNTPIIEYIGEIIRSEVAEVREKRYESQNRGIYMFRLDSNRVVDATVTGGLARYINHSCGPNCFTETVEIERDVKIIIVSNRRIQRGEELAYDYKFDEEEDHKIPCLCGAENCRKWMN